MNLSDIYRGIAIFNMLTRTLAQANALAIEKPLANFLQMLDKLFGPKKPPSSGVFLMWD